MSFPFFCFAFKKSLTGGISTPSMLTGSGNTTAPLFNSALPSSSLSAKAFFFGPELALGPPRIVPSLAIFTPPENKRAQAGLLPRLNSDFYTRNPRPMSAKKDAGIWIPLPLSARSDACRQVRYESYCDRTCKQT